MAQEDRPPVEAEHIPVMPEEVAEVLAPRPGEVCLDVTLGLGGHAEALVGRLGAGMYIGLDRDPEALGRARARLRPVAGEATLSLHRAEFADARHVMHAAGIKAVDMLLADLGVSSMQLDLPERGLAHRFPDAPLDVRMDPTSGVPLAERLAMVDAGELARVLKEFGEVRQARRVAAAILDAAPATAGELVAALEPLAPREVRGKLTARVFQALRIWINDELGQLDRLLAAVPELIAPGGRVAVLSYHSLEDRRVKRAMRDWEQGCTCPPGLPVCVCGKQPLGKAPFRKPLRPGRAEVDANPRARSARLRAFVFAGEGA